jgi:hypothetical protein
LPGRTPAARFATQPIPVAMVSGRSTTIIGAVLASAHVVSASEVCCVASAIWCSDTRTTSRRDSGLLLSTFWQRGGAAAMTGAQLGSLRAQTEADTPRRHMAADLPKLTRIDSHRHGCHAVAI